MSQLHPDEAILYIEWKAWDAARFGRFRRADRAYFAAELKASGIQLTIDTRVLEIGFGNATFAGWVRETSSHYVGTESNPALLERARKIGMEVHPGATDLATIASGRQFDLIVAFDVLEHLELSEILALLNSIRNCLSTNGRFMFRVPSGDSPFSGPLMYGDITHKTKLGSKAVAQLADLAGLDVVATRDVALPILGGGLRSALASASVKAARKLIGTLIKLTFNGNKHAVMSRNMIGVLKLKQMRD